MLYPVLEKLLVPEPIDFLISLMHMDLPFMHISSSSSFPLPAKLAKILASTAFHQLHNNSPLSMSIMSRDWYVEEPPPISPFPSLPISVHMPTPFNSFTIQALSPVVF